MSNNSVLFVFYTINPDSATREWRYPSLLPGWHWIGGGSTNPVKGERLSSRYLQEEQFNGPVGSRPRMRTVLKEYFDRLKSNGIVSRYKIRNTYSP